MKNYYVIFGILVILANCFASIYNYEVSTDSTDSFDIASFRVNIHDSIEIVKGVYFYCPLEYSDMRYYAEDTIRFHCAIDQQFAIMGARLDNMDMSSGIGETVFEALSAIADSSGHDELRYAPLFLEGFSWGGQWAYSFTTAYPERVIGFCTQKGGRHDSTFTLAHINVPGYMIIGELDLDYRLTNLTNIFEEHREYGALWALAIQPGSGHSAITDRDFLDTWFHSIVELRLPVFVDDSFPELITIDESYGYLGNRESIAIGQWVCFDELDRNDASWLPDRANAIYWQAFVSESLITDTIACESTIIEETNHSQVHYSNSNFFTDEITLSANSGIIGIYNLEGRQIFDCDCEKNIIWKPSWAIPSGIYFAQFLDNSIKPMKIVYLK